MQYVCPVSANPRIRPADPIHRDLSPLLLLLHLFLRLLLVPETPTSSAPQKGPQLTRERSDGRIETRCTATTMIIDTRFLKSDLGGRMFTRRFCVIPCRLTHVRGTTLTAPDLFINFKALGKKIVYIVCNCYIAETRASDDAFDLLYIFFF